MKKHLLKTLVALLAIAATAINPAWGQNTMVVWPQTAYGDLQTGDTVIIVDQTSSTAMSNDNGTSSAPTAVSVTLNSAKDTMTSVPADNLKWVVERDGSTYKFKKLGTSNYLYCTSADDGVRVGSGNKSFEFQNGGTYNVPFLRHSSTSRWVGVFNNQDWRSKNESVQTIISNTVIAFYKNTVVVIPVPHTVRFAEGTEDATNWTIAPPEATTTGVLAGSTLTATYSGDLKIKEVIATKHRELEPNEIPLTMEALTAGTIVVQYPKEGMQYTLNGGAKTPVTSNAINVSVGDRVAFYGNGTSITSYSGTNIAGGTAEVNVYGNSMSLVDEENYATATTLTANYQFYYLFGNNEHLKDASGLLLPATTLAEGCYYDMFLGCTSLTTAPALPATTLATECYAYMFEGCTSLTTAPALPATTLAYCCYFDMFFGCTSLTTAPALPATTMANSCYAGMFSGCTSLTTAPALDATTMAPSCYAYIFDGCTSLTAAPALPATTLDRYCYFNMFRGCTSLTTVPSNLLPATTLAKECYSSMFENCSTLTAAPALPATTMAEACYKQMFRGCTSLTTVPSNLLPATTMKEECYYGMFDSCTNLTAAPVLPATTLAEYCYAVMFQNCSSLTAAPALPATTLAAFCYGAMFYGCSSLTAAPVLPATTLTEFCYTTMFAGCTSLTTAPVLPATTLTNWCYRSMFYGCSNLNSVTCLATTNITAPNCTGEWLYGVAATGTFYANPSTNWPTNSEDGIPSGWTRQNAPNN